MARKNFSLKDIKLLADRYSRLGDPETVALFQTIQTFYAPGQNPEDRDPIDPLEVLKKQSSVSRPENQEQGLIWLNSLREKLNRELFDIISGQGNPAELIVGPDYTFIQIVENPVSQVEATPERRKFKESEITFNLPDELKREFEQQLERLKEKEEQTNIKMRGILAKEKELEENKVRLEQENSEFRIRLQKLREEEQKHIEQSKEQSEKETARLRQALEETREELETLRNERSSLLTEHEASRSKLDTDFSRRDQIFRAKFDEMADLMEKMFAEEKTLHKRKEQDYKSSKAKQLQIKKVSQQQAKKNQLLVKLSKSLETEKTTFKLRLKKEFEKRKEELEQEYQRKSEYHIRRLEEFEEDEERLGRENEKLRIREQGLALEAKRKVDEQTKKRLAELEKREKEFARKQKILNKHEKENGVEKASLLKELSGIQGGEFAVDQIKTAAEIQDDLLKRKRKLLKAMEEDPLKVEQEIQKKTRELEEAFEKETKKVAEQTKALLEQQKRQRNKEKVLLERESQELKLMNEEFEEFKNSLEVEQIEKEMAIDEKEEKLLKEEQKILALQQQQMAEEKQVREQISEAEAEAMQELQDIQLIKADVAQHQEEVKNFLNDFNITYSNILNSQSSDYEVFKKRMAPMEEEAARLTSNLKEKEKFITEETLSAEKEMRERLKHKESMVDSMEDDLRKRVEEYQKFVQELAEVKNSMNEEDEARKAELMHNLSHYENKLTSLGKAFEEISEGFHTLKSPQSTPVSPVEATPQARKFKESEITFNLPDELKREFEQQLERLKEKEEQTNIKMRGILAKEKELEENKVRLEQENSEFRIRLQKLREEEQKHIEQSKEQSEKETARLRQALEETREELETLRNERSSLLTEHEASRSKLDTDFSRRDQIFRAKFDEMADLMEKMFAEEKTLHKRKEQDYKSSKAKQLQIKKVSQQQAKKNQLLVKLSKSLETEKTTFKLRLKKEFEKRKEELEQEYQRKSEYHIRRLEEFEEDEERLGRENEKLRIREQGLALEAKRKVDEQTKKRLAELEKREKEFARKQKILNKHEKENGVEKASLLKELSGIQGGEFAVDQIKTAAEIQDDLLKRKRKLLKAMEEDPLKVEQEIQKKTRELEEAFEKETKKVAEQTKALLEQQKRQRNKEKVLLERESQELKLMNEEFEEFKNSLEVEQIEKEMAIDEKEEKLLKEEQKILALQQQQMAEEKQVREQISEAEAEAMQELQDIQLIKADVAQHQEEVKNFLNDFNITYSNILNSQSSDYEVFKKRMAPMEEEAARLTSNLKEKEKFITEETLSAEKEMRERLKHKESMVDSMEDDLRKRVEEYQKFVQELAEVKNSMNEEDEARKAELMHNLSHYENKLTSLGKAFEEISEGFHTEKEKGQIEFVPEEEDKKVLGFGGALAEAEWPLAIRLRLGLVTSSENSPHIMDCLYKFSEKWDEWVRVPEGSLLMGHPRSKDSAPHKQIQIEKPFLIKKYPVTNIEFFRFINETNYKTEAETIIDAIVYQSGSLALQGTGDSSIRSSFSNPSLGPVKNAYWLCPDGQPDSLYGKHNHPVTQVSWNDAQAYCKWKSELTGQTIRLPSEKEWEYVASNFGKLPPEHFFWDEDRIVEFCNIEETGVLDTLPVDHFPENENAGGIRDLFGNVFEWVQDTHDKKFSNGSSQGLEYKIARGGSFITHFKHIAAWRRISFLKSYCTSFLGFRTVCSEGFHTEKEKGQIEFVPEEEDKKVLGFGGALAEAEWPLAIRLRLGLVTSSENSPHIMDCLYKFSEKWDEWVRVPEGSLLMGHPRSKDSAPHKQIQIEKPFLIKKYPVTNIEFFRFINETNYKTEAETIIDAIVYQSGSLALQGTGDSSIRSSFSNPSLGPVKNAFWLCPDGQPDSLYGKYNHPVTQVTWNDAQAYCKWKSELTGQNIRLPSEREWEYVASDFGKLSPENFFWDEDRIVEFCNIEETGILDTLPVDHFPENEYAGGTMDLFGNVFEWVQDAHDKKISNRSPHTLEYKIARGGSFITHFKHIAAWRRIPFLKSYCTSFLGFRTVCDDV